MDIRKKHIVFLLRAFLLLLFVGYSASISLFYHTHIVRGVPITHSHPYKLPLKKGPVSNHSHTPAQYILIQHFGEISITDSIYRVPHVPEGLFACCVELLSPYSFIFSAGNVCREAPRAPPVC